MSNKTLIIALIVIAVIGYLIWKNSTSSAPVINVSGGAGGSSSPGSNPFLDALGLQGNTSQSSPAPAATSSNPFDALLSGIKSLVSGVTGGSQLPSTQTTPSVGATTSLVPTVTPTPSVDKTSVSSPNVSVQNQINNPAAVPSSTVSKGGLSAPIPNNTKGGTVLNPSGFGGGVLNSVLASKGIIKPVGRG